MKLNKTILPVVGLKTAYIMQIIILDVEYFKMTVVGCRLCQVASSRRKFVA